MSLNRARDDVQGLQRGCIISTIPFVEKWQGPSADREAKWEKICSLFHPVSVHPSDRKGTPLFPPFVPSSHPSFMLVVSPPDGKRRDEAKWKWDRDGILRCNHGSPMTGSGMVMTRALAERVERQARWPRNKAAKAANMKTEGSGTAATRFWSSILP